MMPNNKEIAEKIVLAGLGPKDAATCGGCDMADAIEATLDEKDAQLETCGRCGSPIADLLVEIHSLHHSIDDWAGMFYQQMRG